MRPFRFGVFPPLSKDSLPVEEWTEAVREIEKLGYSTVFRQDHFPTRAYDPIAMLASAASVTKTLNIGSFVFAVDFRHPTILAKAAATLHLLSSGRFEFGIGAGYQINDYNMAGIPYDPARIRVERLDEALKIIKSMWTQDKTNFSGKHYRVSEIEKAGELSEGEYPKIMIGAGGRKMLGLAAQHADIVDIIPPWRGSWSRGFQDQTFDGIQRKINRVKMKAQELGRDINDIEFQILFLRTEITDNPDPIIENIANDIGVSIEDIQNSAYVMVGSSLEIRNRLMKFREETGLNYFVFRIRRSQFDEYAESIVKPLTNKRFT